MEMDELFQTFIMESRELLSAMEESLLALEAAPNDRESLNSLFRAVHTIKGSAGMLELDAIVIFCHNIETVLDRARDGLVTIDPDLMSLLLSCRDHIAMLVEQVAVDSTTPHKPDTLQSCGLLMDQLKVYQVGVPGAVEKELWHISLRFDSNVLNYGMDPLSYIRQLKNIGEIANLVTLPNALPEAQHMNPESCYLGFEFDFHGKNIDKARIEKVFEFVRNDCTLRIVPPHSHIEEYIELIQELPEDKLRLGELLVDCGSLTRNELNEALDMQRLCAELRPQDGEHPLVCQLGDILVEQLMIPSELVDAALVKQKKALDNKSLEKTLVRIQTAKLDRLINLVGEMVIAGATTNLLALRSKDTALLESTFVLSKLVEEIRDSALQLRMVEIGETFNRFNRVVRDLSHELGKNIILSIHGSDIELDKSVVEKIFEPLMHLVRNSIDHGIESASVRQKRGKPAQGKLQLSAYHESGSIVIEVSDDGGGLNTEKIHAKALEKGLITATQTLSEPEIHELVFAPGFSTAKDVSNISGRGVGMDVVRRDIEALRGTVKIDSREGLGSTIEIRLPLTLAIIDGFMVKVGNTAYVLPLELVMECLELSEAQRLEIRDINYFEVHGTLLPFIRLRQHFRDKSRPSLREYLVVVQYAGQRAGLIVDELLGELQTVIKPLGKLFANLKEISGSTLLGNGEVALILDVAVLIQHTT